MLKLSVKL